MAPIIENIALEYPNLVDFEHFEGLFPLVNFARINYVVMPEILNLFTLTVVPDVLYFGDDKANPNKYVGPIDEVKIEDWVYSNVGGSRIPE